MARPNSLDGRLPLVGIVGADVGATAVCPPGCPKPTRLAGQRERRSLKRPMADSYVSRLIAHLAWADDRVLAALRSATNPDPSCRELFAHVLAAEHVWL